MFSNESSDKAVEPALVITSTQDAALTPMPLRRASTSSMFVGPRPTILQELQATFGTSWLNILIPFVPAAWALHFSRAPAALVFSFSFLAALSLGNLRSLVSEDLAKHWGYLDKWFAVTMGNSVDLIAVIIALRNDELRVVQSRSLVGSILSYLLLVLSLSVFPGAAIDSSLSGIARGAWLRSASWHTADDRVRAHAAITLLSLYASCVVFQLFLRKHVFARFSSDGVEEALQYRSRQERNEINAEKAEKLDETWVERAPVPVPDIEAADSEKRKEEEIPRSNVIFDIICMIVCIGLTIPILEGLVGPIGTLAASGKISQEWAGLILIPFIGGNTAAHIRFIVNRAKKDELNEFMMVVVGSSIQLALLHILFVTLTAWGVCQPLTFLFDPFENVTLFLTVLIMNYISQDGKGSLLVGMVHLHLCMSFAVLLTWFMPVFDLTSKKIKN